MEKSAKLRRIQKFITPPIETVSADLYTVGTTSVRSADRDFSSSLLDDAIESKTEVKRSLLSRALRTERIWSCGDVEEDNLDDDEIPAPRAFSVHDVANTGLDNDARRVFYYTSHCLWAMFGQRLVETGESIAAAMTRLCFRSPYTMATFLWSGAMELGTHTMEFSTQKVMLEYQNIVVKLIQKDLRQDRISDELIHAVYALASSNTRPGLLSQKHLPWRSWIPHNYVDPYLVLTSWADFLDCIDYEDHHANAAARLLESSGGLESMRNVVFAYQIQAYDLLRVSRTGSKSRFSLCRTYKDMLEVQMPMYRSPCAINARWPISDEFKDLMQDLRCYLRQLGLYAANIHPTVSTETMVAWRNINQYRVLALPTDRDQLYRLVVLIFCYNVTYPVPWQDPVREWVRELVFHLHMASDDSESALWGAIVAALTQPDQEVFSCLLERAKRARKALGLKTWNDVKLIMPQFLWLESACDVAAQKFWNLIVGREDDELEDGSVKII